MSKRESMAHMQLEERKFYRLLMPIVYLFQSLVLNGDKCMTIEPKEHRQLQKTNTIYELGN